MKIKRIGVIYGGKSSEREISLKTGTAIAKALKEEYYSVILLDSGKANFVKKILKSKIDFAFIALHGPGGEDGSMQGFLETLDIPYNGCGVLASAVSMDKIYSKKIFEYENIPTPEWYVISLNTPFLDSRFSFPVIVKPARQGSAIGINIARKKTELKRAIKEALKYDSEVIIEQYIEGKEVTVAILGDRALTPIEIIPKNEFYDFYSKYSAGGSEHLVPARLSDKISKKAMEIGLRAHKSLGCKAVSRIDMIIDKRNNIYVLEVNTIPGMTNTSLLPDAAKYEGISFGKLLKNIIYYSLNEKI
ncbi:MAG: hypothetical protein A2474_08175 [Elusimicrobia bacterium RIFOXYC2_FULL_34_12]|nr:MAG: hypothetical protein A2474_08175 [Elusimicrobia bacterium RIFOXYC2_FULL_34_12]